MKLAWCDKLALCIWIPIAFLGVLLELGPGNMGGWNAFLYVSLPILCVLWIPLRLIDLVLGGPFVRYRLHHSGMKS